MIYNTIMVNSKKKSSKKSKSDLPTPVIQLPTPVSRSSNINI